MRMEPLGEVGDVPQLPQMHLELEQTPFVQGQSSPMMAGGSRLPHRLHGQIVRGNCSDTTFGDPLQQALVAAIQNRAGFLDRGVGSPLHAHDHLIECQWPTKLTH